MVVDAAAEGGGDLHDERARMIVVREAGGAIELTVQEVTPLEGIRERLAREMEVRINLTLADETLMGRLKDLLRLHSGARSDPAARPGDLLPAGLSGPGAATGWSTSSIRRSTAGSTSTSPHGIPHERWVPARAGRDARPGHGAADAADHHAEHDQADEHLDQFDETVAERFELGRVFRKGQPADDAEHQSENHLEED